MLHPIIPMPNKLLNRNLKIGTKLSYILCTLNSLLETCIVNDFQKERTTLAYRLN